MGLTKLIQLILTESGAGGSGRGDEVTSTIFQRQIWLKSTALVRLGSEELNLFARCIVEQIALLRDNIRQTKLKQLILTKTGARGKDRGDEVTPVISSARLG